jgi:hypothetical protein
MKSPDAVLEEALDANPRNDLHPYREAIKALRDKGYSWRESADWLGERGIRTDHTKLLRFWQKYGDRWQVPAAGAYLVALKHLRSQSQISKPQWDMLLFLYAAHNRTATYTQLALAAKKGGAKVQDRLPHNYANRFFGGLGKTIGEALGMDFLQSEIRDAPFYSSSIGIGSTVTPEGAEFEIVMHHELAKALDLLVTEHE